jgi:uncharacterized membrane protein
VKPLVVGLVALAALVVATFVASSIANQLVEIAAPLAWWALLLCVWPAVLFVASQYQHRRLADGVV